MTQHEKEARKILKKLEKCLDENRCDVHHYLEPDGRCSCDEQFTKMIKIASKLVVLYSS